MNHIRFAIHLDEPRSICARLACVGLATLAVAIGGCGGSAHGGGATTAGRPDVTTTQPSEVKETPAEARFIARADKICQKLDVFLNAEGLAPKSASRQEAKKLAGVRAGLEQQSVTELKRLKAPRSLADKWREILRLRTSLAHELGEYGRAAAAADQSAIAALARSKAQVHKDLAKVGGAAGFQACSAVH